MEAILFLQDIPHFLQRSLLVVVESGDDGTKILPLLLVWWFTASNIASCAFCGNCTRPAGPMLVVGNSARDWRS